MTIAQNLAAVQQSITRAEAAARRAAGSVQLVAVSKTHGPEAILPTLTAGQRLFGENRVQEAQGKWPALRAQFPDLQLHLIGPLQTNKVKEAVALFDVIQTVDRPRLVEALAREMERSGRRPACLVQVNTGAEPQKAGVLPDEAAAFIAAARQRLPVVGLMCIPPVDQDPAPHFALLRRLADEAGLPERSMGMSGDFEAAIAQGATLVRVGTAIFGHRPVPGPAA